jgi:hypothetical protein
LQSAIISGWPGKGTQVRLIQIYWHQNKFINMDKFQ